jgi:hypothetical protein
MRISLLSGSVGAVVLLSVLAGCSSSESGTASPASGGASAGSSAADSSGTAETPPSADALQSAVLQDEDLPAGWRGTAYDPSSDDDDDDDGTAALLKCIGAEDNSADEVEEAHSPDFSSEEGSSISSSATSFRSQEAIEADVAVFSDPAAPGCFAEQMSTGLADSGLPAGTTVGEPQISFTAGSGGGPSNVVASATGTIPVTVSGQQITFYLDVAFITGRLTEASVEFFGVGAPVPADLQSSLVAAVADRVDAL